MISVLLNFHMQIQAMLFHLIPSPPPHESTGLPRYPPTPNTELKCCKT